MTPHDMMFFSVGFFVGAVVSAAATFLGMLHGVRQARKRWEDLTKEWE
jgi:Na+/H+-translocating membrane pyrophosphatase